jgi:DNA-binding SARP family transcriptional activator
MLEVFLLGPVGARSDGTSLALAPLERNLLALLALAKGAVLSTERIIDGLWADRPPAAARSRVQGLVSSLRRKVGGGLVTHSPGYLLRLDDDACDLARCERIAALGRRATDPVARSAALRQALALWCGEPLDGVLAPGAEADRVRLAELRAGLLEDLFESELALGRHAGLVGELIAAVLADPLRERLTGQLMTALYRSNRQAEALRAYQAVRKRLAEELGSDPCAELRELQAAILRGDGPAPTTVGDPGAAGPRRVGDSAAAGRERAGGTGRRPPPPDRPPAQMPAPVGHFVGREGELAALSAALPGSGEEARVLLVSGAGGLGKTALTVQWGHAVADQFPDGQVFVECSGSAAGATLPPGAVLGVVLLALGVDADRLPTGVEERAALYRTLAHGRRILVLADDARSVAQLLPLVPPTSGSLLVATGRSNLAAMGAHHAARTLTLRPLSQDCARDLLRRLVGPDRLPGQTLADLVDLCAGWPLALRIVGATLATRAVRAPDSLLAEIADGIEVLSVGDDPRTVHQGVEQALADLDPAAGRLFDQLGLLGTSSVPLHLAAAAAGVSVLRARRLLDELVSASLVLAVGPDRFGLHAMIARCAARRGATLADRAVVEERAARWYLAVYEHLARLIHPDEDRPAADGPREWLPFGAVAPGEAFVVEQSAELPSVVAWLAGRGDPGLTWRVVSALYAVWPGLPVGVCQAGLAAAQQLGAEGRQEPEASPDSGRAADHRPAVIAARALGEARAQLGAVLLGDPLCLDAAREQLTLATELLGDDEGRLTCVAAVGLGAVLGCQGQSAQARSLLERGLDLLDPSREPLACAVTLFAYGTVLVRSGSADHGHERLAQALVLGEASVGRRFGRDRPYLSRQFGEGFLDGLADSLSSARVGSADRWLTQVLLALSRGTLHRGTLAVA